MKKSFYVEGRRELKSISKVPTKVAGIIDTYSTGPNAGKPYYRYAFNGTVFISDLENLMETALDVNTSYVKLVSFVEGDPGEEVHRFTFDSFGTIEDDIIEAQQKLKVECFSFANFKADPNAFARLQAIEDASALAKAQPAVTPEAVAPVVPVEKKEKVK